MRGGGRQGRGGRGSQLNPIASLSCLRCCWPGSSSGSRWAITPAESWCRFWIAASMCVQDSMCMCVFERVKKSGAGGTSVSDPPERREGEWAVTRTQYVSGMEWYDVACFCRHLLLHFLLPPASLTFIFKLNNKHKTFYDLCTDLTNLI